MKRQVLDLHARDAVLKLGHETRIMGIINCTPDSFSGDGLFKHGRMDPAACLDFARRLIRDGADILDIGGESTRPGATSVALAEEIRRVVPVIELLARKLKVPISVDTSKMEVARRALDAGVSIINNIQGTKVSTDFLKMVRSYNAAIVLMHTRGTPATMGSLARYKDVVREVTSEIKISVEKCLQVGIKRDGIIVDPGIGFAKTLEHNLTLIAHLDKLNALRCPVLLGTSRKSFIGKILQQEAGQRLTGTLATAVAGAMQGAHIVRAHDVKPVKEALKVTDAILRA